MKRIRFSGVIINALGPALGLMILLFFACRSKPAGRPLGSTYAELSKPEIWKIPGRSAAQLAGLKSGDVIISYNEEPVASITEFYQLENEVVGAGGRDSVKLTVLRDEQELSLQVPPVRLGFIPKSGMYASSLAKALDDIIQHYGQPGIYDWLAALSGGSFSLMLDEDNCYSWGTDGLTEDYLTTVGKFTGLSFRLRYHQADSVAPVQPGADSVKGADPGLLSIREGLAHNQNLLVYGRWGNQPFYLWGVVSRIDADDSTIYGYTLDYGQEQALHTGVVRVYEVDFRGAVKPDPVQMTSTILEQALELGLRSSDTGWHSGLEAYDILQKKFEQFPVCLQGIDVSNDCFYRLVWRLVASKESANRFFAEMKEALPEQADLFDEVMGRNRAIIGKLEGIAAAGLRLDSPANQQKAARVLAEIQEIENDLLGFYEEIIGEL